MTLCHTGTRDLAAHVRRADIVVAAAGVPGLITADMVKPGAAVLDVGVSRVDGKIAGDVAPDVAEVAGYLAPNPGGVGPMTRAMLLTNVVEAAERAGGRAGALTVALQLRRRIRAQGPFLLVVALLAAAFGYMTVEPGHWVRGTSAISAAMLVAGGLRLTLPEARAGMLAVRGRWWDALCNLTLGVLILLVSIRLRR